MKDWFGLNKKYISISPQKKYILYAKTDIYFQAKPRKKI